METNDEALDLIWGIGNIGKLIGRSYAQTYHMVREGRLPVKQIGERYVASRRKLVEYLTEDAA